MNAIISACGNYRYSLTREWIGGEGLAVFIMLNPSTADASQDDQTIRRCINFAKSWGMAQLEVVNLYAWRATDPSELAVPDPIGPDNDGHIQAAVERADILIAAWGMHAGVKRAADVRRMAENNHRSVPLTVLGLTKDGFPRHPLFVRQKTQPQLWGAGLA